MQVDTVINETPGVSGGYPSVGDSRVRVALVVEAYKRVGNIDHVAEMFDLTHEQVLGALHYYDEHPERVDEDIRRNRRDTQES